MKIQKIFSRLKNVLAEKWIPLYRKIQKLFSRGNGNNDDLSYGDLEEHGIRDKLRKYTEKTYVKYIAFVICASLICILPAQLSHGSELRIWCYNLFHKDIIGKGMEYTVSEENDNREKGTFLTYYRFQEFGASNPAEVDPAAPMVALTFDDGPNPEYTTRILEVLNENYSHATFFVVGTNAEKYPDVLKAISSSGNEIGNHTYSHANLTELNTEEVEEQIDKVNRAVKKATGEVATVIRPPYGAFDESVLGQLQEPVILWDLDTEDWESRNAQTIVDHVMEEVEDGDIILMHDIYDSTAEAVELLVPKLKEQGYQIVSVSEMAHYKGKELELNKAYGGIKDSAQ